MLKYKIPQIVTLTRSLSRSDRMAKYNQLLRIEEEIGNNAVYGYKRIK